jgi:uncharacterized protein YprB with RNaseH-like and TPR domain
VAGLTRFLARPSVFAAAPLQPDATADTRRAGDRDTALPADRPVRPVGGYVGFDIGYFDLEATGLNGSFGRLHCGACAHVDGSVWVARIDDPRYQNKRQRSDDGKLAVAIRDHLETHDILVSWNGKRSYSTQGRGGFDVPMLNARLINVRERLLDRYAEHIDLLKEARKHLQLAQYRLASVQTFLELQEEKSAITPRVWQKALDHDKDAMDYIVDHCERDVLVLREVFEEFRRTRLLRRASR